MLFHCTVHTLFANTIGNLSLVLILFHFPRPIIRSIHTCLAAFMLQLCKMYTYHTKICSNTFLCTCCARNTQIIKDVAFFQWKSSWQCASGHKHLVSYCKFLHLFHMLSCRICKHCYKSSVRNQLVDKTRGQGQALYVPHTHNVIPHYLCLPNFICQNVMIYNVACKLSSVRLKISCSFHVLVHRNC